jgi:integrase
MTRSTDLQPRRPKGTGGVRRLPSGKFQAMVMVRGQRVYKTFATATDANRWARNTNTDAERGEAPTREARTITVEQWSKEWMESRSGNAPRTEEERQRHLDLYILPKVGPLKVVDLTDRQVKLWRSGIVRQKGTGVAAKSYQTLRAMMNGAVEGGIIKASPCRVKGGGTENHPERPIIEPETVDLLAAAMAPRFRLMVELATWCQLRYQELAALQRDHFIIGTGISYVRVEQAVTEPKGQGRVIRPTKNTDSRRVTIPPHLVPGIKWHLNAFVEPGRDAWFFTGEHGAPLRKANWFTVWKRGREKVGDELPRDFHFHDLRHSGGTYFARTGATIRETMDRMGHRTPRAAMIYQHAATADREAEHAASLSNLRRPGQDRVRQEA